jgi:hypothetical protein
MLENRTRLKKVYEGNHRNASRSTRMLLANVTQQIVPTREALCSTTAFDMTEQLCRRRCVLPFVSVAVFGVDEAFLADAALVRPLGALQVRFLVTSQIAFAIEGFLAARMLAREPVLACSLPPR